MAPENETGFLFWKKKKPQDDIPRQALQKSPEEEAKALCKPLVVAGITSFEAALEEITKWSAAVVTSSDFSVYAVENLLQQDHSHNSEVSYHYTFKIGECRTKARSARVGGRTCDTAVACTTLVIDLARVIVNEALAVGLFGDDTPSASFTVAILSPKPSKLPWVERPQQDRVDAAFTALEVTIAATQSLENKGTYNAATLHAEYIQSQLRKLEGFFREAREAAGTLHKVFDDTSRGWWQKSAEGTLFSASPLAQVTAVIRSAADCVRATGNILLESEKLLSAANHVVYVAMDRYNLVVPEALERKIQDRLPTAVISSISAAQAANTQASSAAQLAANMALEATEKKGTGVAL